MIIAISSFLIKFNDNLEIIFFAAFSSTIISSSFLSLHAFYEKSNRIKVFISKYIKFYNFFSIQII